MALLVVVKQRQGALFLFFSMGSWPGVSATGILIIAERLYSRKGGPIFGTLSSRSEDQTDSTFNLGELPQQCCLYPEVILKEYIVFGCQCSKASRQKIPFQKKVWLMKLYKSCRGWSNFRNHTIQIKDASFFYILSHFLLFLFLHHLNLFFPLSFFAFS